MNATLAYVFDPLCGWCYGASAAVQALADSDAVTLKLLPSGLFQDEGARKMDDAFAAYAWSNDQRIERLTGQAFTPLYRELVLADRNQRFDSGPATLALTAVWLTQPEQEVNALKAIQHARYVEGLDITRPDTLSSILRSLGLTDAAQRFDTPDAALHAAMAGRLAEAQDLMNRLGARGVPTFVRDVDGRQTLLPAGAVYANPKAFLAQLTEA